MNAGKSIAETIIGEAVRRGGTVGCDRSIADCTDEEWKEAKDMLARYGAVVEWNDKRGGFRFEVNEEGIKLNANGGFEWVERERRMREKEVEAAMEAAEQAGKANKIAEEALRTARRANRIAVTAIVVTVLIAVVSLLIARCWQGAAQ